MGNHRGPRRAGGVLSSSLAPDPDRCGSVLVCGLSAPSGPGCSAAVCPPSSVCSGGSGDTARGSCGEPGLGGSRRCCSKWAADSDSSSLPGGGGDRGRQRSTRRAVSTPLSPSGHDKSAIGAGHRSRNRWRGRRLTRCGGGLRSDRFRGFAVSPARCSTKRCRESSRCAAGGRCWPRASPVGLRGACWRNTSFETIGAGRE
mmetsp:Transcript_86634/g.250202  ORF Transcript_86634/g.250202 Transcript_86634/m.250202 type:complete len:201 (-) Transcript_86634:124-726(-)